MDSRRHNPRALPDAQEKPEDLEIELNETLAALSARQHADGGWSHRSSRSSTEATALAVLALTSENALPGPALDRAMAWLSKSQRMDGGWAPHSGVERSTWVTALVLLLPDELTVRLNWKAGVEWLLGITGRESGVVERLRSLMITGKPAHNPDGWPFYPDTAAWVCPTAFSILALSKVGKRMTKNSEVQQRLAEGRNFLMSRRCADSGWNHGSTRALGYDTLSYPESTGLALTSLKGADPVLLEPSLKIAQKHLENCRSLEAVRWLELGLRMHGQKIVPVLFESSRVRLTQELAIDAIAAAAASGRNPLEAS